jgi:hypothetical protein
MLQPYAPVVIELLRGVIYNDDKEYWENLLKYQVQIGEYLDIIGIDLIISTSEGYAFLRQKQLGEDSVIKVPSLIEKRQLSYPITLLCVLLAEKLYEFDIRGGNESNRLVMDRDEIKEMLSIFFQEKANEVKLIDSLDAYINKLIAYGFLRKLHDTDNKYEVKRILKAKVSAVDISSMKNNLKEYVSHAR